MANKLFFIILLCAVNLMEVWCISGRITSNSKYCVPQPYKPGGGIRTVQEVKAPKAILKTTGFLGVIAKGATQTGNAGKVSTKVTTHFAKFGKLFKTASKMAPWLAAVSGALGFLGSSPTPQQAVDATNKALKEFAEEVNKRMIEMKGYVDDSILKSESVWVKKQYEVLFEGWANCMIYYYKDESAVNECQRTAFMDIRKNRAHFMLFKGKNPSRQELKRLEFQFEAIREYSFLTLLVLRSLIDSFKAEKGKTDDFVFFMKQGMIIPEELADYAKFVNSEILDFYDSQTKSICRRTLTCSKMKSMQKTNFFGQKLHPYNRNMECKCKMIPDAASHEWCKYRLDVSVSSSERWGQHWTDSSNMEKKGERELFALSDRFWRQTSSVVRKYWHETVMVQVPKWEEFAIQAEKEYQLHRGGNLALKRPTYHSSAYNQWNQPKSSFAVDGNYNQCLPRDHLISQTGYGSHESWRVILDGIYEIKSVILYNVVDNWTSDDLSNVNIYVDDIGDKRSFCAKTGNMKHVYIKEYKCAVGAIGNVVLLLKPSSGRVSLCEVVVYGAKVKRNGPNLALSQPTLQSTTIGQHSSSRAVDGQKSKCSLSENTCSKTDIPSSGKRNWWEVVLDSRYHIDSVIIYGCGSTLANIVIFAIDEYANTNDEMGNRRRSIFEGRSHQKVSVCKFVTKINETAKVHNFKCDHPAYGNILRIAKNIMSDRNEEVLQLCEVEVYGHQFKIQRGEMENIAYRGQAAESNDHYSYTKVHTAGRAVNGNHMNCRLPQNTLTRIVDRYTAWWQVRLPSLSKVESVIIYNRIDCCTEELSNAIIYVTEIENEYYDRKMDFRFNVTGNMTDVNAREFTSQYSMFGHIVKIEKEKSNEPLTLCEVEVYGKKVTKSEIRTIRAKEACEIPKKKIEQLKKEGKPIPQHLKFRMEFSCGRGGMFGGFGLPFGGFGF
eukprot:TCONS_00000150-protein